MSDNNEYEYNPFEDPIPEPALSACECGKDKHGFITHSQWCPKWEKIQ